MAQRPRGPRPPRGGDNGDRPPLRGDPAAPAPGAPRLPGMDDAERWADALARDIEDYKAGRIAWREVDRGVVLVGAPGTGKTTFVRNLAQRLGAPLIATSYADWQRSEEGHLGDVQRAMKSRFAEARTAVKAKGVALLFIDEIDAIPDRASPRCEHREWWTSIIDGLLEHCDGAEQHPGVVLIGACNDTSRIDRGLLRPGRLGRRIDFPLPDADALERIYSHYLGDRLGGADLSPFGLRSIGMTGADVEQIVNDALRVARHADRPLAAADIERLLTAGEVALPEEHRRRAAIHEAGHATFGVKQGVVAGVSITILQRGAKLGTTAMRLHIRSLTREQAVLQVGVHMAGRAAEELLLGAVSAGSGGPRDSDLAQATRLAIECVASFGLADGLPPFWPDEEARIQAFIADPCVAAEVKAVLQEGYDLAFATLSKHRHALLRLVEAVHARKALGDAEIRAILGGPDPGLDDAMPEPC